MRSLLTRLMIIVSLVAGMTCGGIGLANVASAATGDTLAAGQQLTVGQSLVSTDGRYTAIMQGDGNFVVYGPAGAGWNTGVSSADHIVMQADGNLDTYNSANNYTWSSGTATSHNDRLVMQSDGNLVIYSGNNVALWVNGTHLQSADTLAAGQQLTVGQSLVSTDGRYTAIMQGDGKLAVYGPAGAGWNTGVSSADHIVMQADGNLVTYNSANNYTWSSGTAPSSGDRLVMQSDGNLVIYNGSNTALWSNGQLLIGPSPVDDYPAQWRNVAQDSVFDTWREYNRECTSFVAWRLHSRSHFEMPFNANANMWGSKAQALGYHVDTNPTVGSIAWTTAGGNGHVAWVQAVNGSVITIEDYNSGYTGRYGVHANVASATYQYIHFAN